MKKLITAGFIGVLFGFGLIISGMTSPTKVIAFLNVNSENFDISLAFVMLGAICVYLPIYNLVIKKNLKKKPILASKYHLPQHNNISKKMLVGSALFGIGWGILGICPGPAIVNLLSSPLPILIFLISLYLGIKLSCFIYKKS